MWFYIANSDKS